MGKRAVPFVIVARGKKPSKKHMSHGSFRCARHPNSKRCNNGSTK